MKNAANLRQSLLAACLIFGGLCHGPAATAQSRAYPYKDEAARARQALLHTEASRRSPGQRPRGYRPKHERLVNAEEQLPIEPLPLQRTQDGEIRYEGGEVYEGGVYGDGVVMESGDGLGEWHGEWGSDVVQDGGGECDCHSCTIGCGGYDQGVLSFGGPMLNLHNTSLFAGVQGFTGPPDLGSTGSFGFHEGFNIGIPFAIFPNSGMGGQIGVRTVQSNISGADFTSRQRNQTFFTVGAFRRSSWGFQGGLVVDMQRDRWYDRVDTTQLRGQISWKYPARHEWGYWFTAAGSGDTSQSAISSGQIDSWDPTSLHAFFYRRRLDVLPGGQLSLMAGFSGEKDGLIGTKAYLPLTAGWALQSDFLYLVPEEATRSGGTLNEGWHMALSLVWRLGLDSQCTNPGPYRPLFEVADNGTMMLDRTATFRP